MQCILRSKLVAFGIALTSLSACGRQPPQESVSNLDFLPGSSATRVLVEEKDLSDTFLFGAIATDIDTDTPSAVIGMNSDLARVVKLNIVQAGGKKYLSIDDALSKEHILTFKVTGQNSKTTEVDFADSPNGISAVGVIGIDPDVMSSAAVTKVVQSQNEMAVDVAYKLVGKNAKGAMTAARFSVRFWWKRRVADKDFEIRDNIDGLGYFTTAGIHKNGGLRSGHINRINLSRGPVVFTLVDFPKEFVQTATKAIKAWELALGAGTIKVETASAGNVGDPRSIVVRWYPHLPEDVKFAGLTYNSGDPVTGERAASAVLINGTPIDLYSKIYRGTEASYRAYLTKIKSTKTDGDALVEAKSKPEALTLGGLKLSRSSVMMADLEALPFLPDASVPFETYIQGYYYDVIVHEVGHIFGLRHNFRASLVTDEETGRASSVMDYADRQNRYKADRIGSYDLAAIRYGYFGEEPSQEFEFCSDEDLSSDPLCNQGDDGRDVAQYFQKATTQLIEFVSAYDFDFEFVKESVGAMFSSYAKLATLDSDYKSAAQEGRRANLKALDQASGKSQTSKANLELLRKLAKKNLTTFEPQEP